MPQRGCGTKLQQAAVVLATYKPGTSQPCRNPTKTVYIVMQRIPGSVPTLQGSIECKSHRPSAINRPESEKEPQGASSCKIAQGQNCGRRSKGKTRQQHTQQHRYGSVQSSHKRGCALGGTAAEGQTLPSAVSAGIFGYYLPPISRENQKRT